MFQSRQGRKKPACMVCLVMRLALLVVVVTLLFAGNGLSRFFS
ncbi:hypothetical protein [Marinobacterium arenosum]|nr:hypothetical protein [Marinobacterium arenosum]